MSKIKFETIEVAISKVKPNDDNPRILKDDKFKKLVKSIREFPQMLKIRPIVVNDEMIVLGGNMRLRACQEAGLKKIPIIKANELTEKQQREFIIKDNVGFGEWDWDMLANEWEADDLNEWGLDTPDEWAVELEAEEDDYIEPQNIQVDVVLGDLIEIGEHRLLCGDSTDSDQVAKLMNGKKADMVFTDPPYGVSYTGGHNKKQRKGIESDEFKNEDLSNLFQDSINNACIFSCSSWASSASTRIRPLCSSVMIFFREAISSCTCGGMVKKEPAEAPRSMGTTARPFRTEDRILL